MKTILIAVLLSVCLFGASLADAKRYYVPGSKTDQAQAKYRKQKTQESRDRTMQMFYDDLNYREAKSDQEYRNRRREIDIEERERKLEGDD